MEQVEGTLVQVSSWRQLRGKTRWKRGRNLRRSSATLTRRALPLQKVDLPMNTQTLRYCC